MSTKEKLKKLDISLKRVQKKIDSILAKESLSEDDIQEYNSLRALRYTIDYQIENVKDGKPHLGYWDNGSTDEGDDNNILT